MEIIIKGTPDEIQKMLLAVESSEEQIIANVELSSGFYTQSEMLKEGILMFILGIFAGCMLFPLGTELLKWLGT